jgi:hypothetical protein
LEELTASVPRRRFVRKKKQNYSKEMITGGIVAAVIAVVGLVYLTVNGTDTEKHGLERLANEKPTVASPKTFPPEKDLKKEAAKTKHTARPATAPYVPPNLAPRPKVHVRPIRPSVPDDDSTLIPRTFERPAPVDETPPPLNLPTHPHDDPGLTPDVIGIPPK